MTSLQFPPFSLLLASLLNLSLNSHLLSTYDVLGAALAAELKKKDEAPVLREW